jgi:hypothetical protein
VGVIAKNESCIMKTFPIPNFRPVETKSDASNQDRTVLRRAEGVVAVSLGALSPGPRWRTMWGMSDLGTQIATALSGANVAKAHFVIVARGNHRLLVVWSLALSEALGVFHVVGDAADPDFASATNVTITATNSAVFRDKDPSAPWYMSALGSRLILGNGIDANLTWMSGALALFEAPTATNVNDPYRVTFPPCTQWVIGPNRFVYAAGNASAPLRIYEARPPTTSYDDVVGIQSADTSKIDVLLSGATAIRAISVWQSYVSVHLNNNKVVNLYSPGQDNQGQRARQGASAANGSALNPGCVGDPVEHGPYYFGGDGELYKDEATRAGPYNKHVDRDVDLATAEASSDWNSAMAMPVAARYATLLFDARSNIAWIFTRTSVPSSKAGLWCYAGRADAVTGPFRYPDAVAATLARGFTDRTVGLVVTSAGALLYSQLSDVASLKAVDIDPPGTALGAGYAELTSAPTPDAGVPYVAMNAAGTAFAQVLGATRIELASAWANDWTETTALTLTRFFNNAHLGIVEFGYLDLGTADRIKQFLATILEWSPRARAAVGVFIETERGVRSGKWYGSTFSRETITIPHGISGERVRIRLLIMWFNDQRAELRKLSVG